MRLLTVPARVHFLWLDMGPFEEQLFCEASQETSQNARARLLRVEGIMIPWSKEASFFHRFYRILCAGFSPFGWERGLVYYCLSARKLWSNGFSSFRMRGLHRDKSYNALVVIGITARYRSVLSHFSLILSRVCLLGRLHVPAFYTLF